MKRDIGLFIEDIFLLYMVLRLVSALLLLEEDINISFSFEYSWSLESLREFFKEFDSLLLPIVIGSVGFSNGYFDFSTNVFTKGLIRY